MLKSHLSTQVTQETQVRSLHREDPLKEPTPRAGSWLLSPEESGAAAPGGQCPPPREAPGLQLAVGPEAAAL